MMWRKMIGAVVAVAGPLLLTGCFLTPGVFDSSLDLRRGGAFSFAYKGEIVFAIPDDMMGGKPEVWRDDMATCEDNSSSDGNSMDAGKCTLAQIGEQKKTWEAEQATKAAKAAEESKQFASMFGYAPGDDEANQRMAAQLAKYDGFRSATYAGNGVFNIDYAKSGQLGHDFIFPALLQANVMFPFVLARPQTDGSVRVSAPAFVGNGALGALARMKDMGMGNADMNKLPANRTKGRFVLTTDGEVLTNNTEDGPVAGPRGKTLTWNVDARSAVAPEALVKLR
ncbi:hypothetical protein SPAN111604_10435 [Sphingomonas antarctica]|uniref:hypothetical protein n=1 Tax=Sphingomonas antarctica TaxID=2040274 RepID=UPI0039E9851A